MNEFKGASVPPPLPKQPPPIPNAGRSTPPPLPRRLSGSSFDEVLGAGKEFARALGAAGQELFKTVQSSVGPKLKEEVCEGKTGVFMNGRELGFWELLRMRSYVTLPRGRYWRDAQGNFGAEGGPVLGNLPALEAQARRVAMYAFAASAVAGMAANNAAPQRNGVPGGVLSTMDKCGCVVIG
jgi:hypothetical protein